MGSYQPPPPSLAGRGMEKGLAGRGLNRLAPELWGKGSSYNKRGGSHDTMPMGVDFRVLGQPITRRLVTDPR